MRAVLQPLAELQSYQNVLENLHREKTPILATGVLDSQKSHLIYALAERKKETAVIITADEHKAKEIYDNLLFFSQKNVMIYPSKDLIFYSADVHSMDITEQRIKVLKHLIEGKKGILILSIEALFDKLIPKAIFEKNILYFSVGMQINLEEMIEKLVYMGYERVEQVEGKGQFAVRGGILDLYPIIEEHGYRIELWDDEIDSIRSIDVDSQRSIEKKESIRVYPAIEYVLSENLVNQAVRKIQAEVKDMQKKMTSRSEEYKENLEQTSSKMMNQLVEHKVFKGMESYTSYLYDKMETLLDYIDENSLIFIDEPLRVSERAHRVLQEFNESIKNRLEKGFLLSSQADIIFQYEDILYALRPYSCILLAMLAHRIDDFKLKSIVHFQAKTINPFHQQVDLLVKEMKSWIGEGYRILMLCGSKTRADRVAEELLEYNIPARRVLDLNHTIQNKEVLIYHGSLHKGFEYPEIKFIVLTESDVFKTGKKKTRKKKKYKGSKISSFTDLKIGDYVVHENHGVGVYRGIEQIQVEGNNQDFLKISYKDGGNLYIPTSQLDLVQKYIGGEGHRPKLNKLGGTEWLKTKAKVKKAVDDIANELVELYAKRREMRGYAFSKDTVWQKEFEEMFPFEETEDQLIAIEETKENMESPQIMDRLICGDVGYGKTEVAIRAAFKAIQDGKQVAYLVPTTILAQQHFNNFVERMKDFPVTVDMLSRFRTKKEQSETIAKTRKGLVDILIGTHRLLSKDVRFKDLGLLIIDEEQRFGVTHKEKIKRMKESIDVLTLTATPIPRTLHMSLIGIRGMSVLEEPPQERYPVQTYVMEHNTELIKDAIYRELARGGQVYYVYNRVKNIDIVAAQIQKMIPNAVVSYAHGQMKERELEEIMMEFINGEIDILVCTTIIETGMDISNVNTMIIEDADHMGLSQLYQLKGRVGRTNRIAYAYLLYKRDKVLQESAEKRLQAIRDFTEFGSGFKIAMRDLEIRGAGNLLGAQQHGHMEAVGYDMYSKLLGEAIKEAKNEKVVEQFDTGITLHVNAYIPSDYIPNEAQKLEIYKKIATIEQEKDYHDIYEEIEDRYGDLPPSVIHLLDISLIKAMAHECDIAAVEQKNDKIVFEYKIDARVNVAKIGELMEKYDKKLFFSVTERPKFSYRIHKNHTKQIIQEIKKVLEDLKKLKLDDSST